MNGKQRIPIYAAAVAIVMMFMFPPFTVHAPDGRMVNKGYSFILSYPNEKTSLPIVNTSMLLTQVFGALAVTGLLFIALKNRDY